MTARCINLHFTFYFTSISQTGKIVTVMELIFFRARRQSMLSKINAFKQYYVTGTSFPRA